MTFSTYVVHYTHNFSIILLWIINYQNNIPRVYKHGSYIPHLWFHLINMLVNISLSEQQIAYRTVLHKHCTYLCRIAATYPNFIIEIYGNNVSVSFPQINLHSDPSRENMSLYHTMIIVLITLHFGGTFGPTSWELIVRIIWYVEQCVYLHTPNTK